MGYILFRGAVVIALLFAVALVTRLYRQWQAGLHVGPGPSTYPAVPRSLLGGHLRTWVVFTTPWCASCGPVERRLREVDPDAGLVKVDASREPHLARAFDVRRAPTVLLADGDGRVQARLVGAAEVERFAAG